MTLEYKEKRTKQGSQKSKGCIKKSVNNAKKKKKEKKRETTRRAMKAANEKKKKRTHVLCLLV